MSRPHESFDARVPPVPPVPLHSTSQVPWLEPASSLKSDQLFKKDNNIISAATGILRAQRDRRSLPPGVLWRISGSFDVRKLSDLIQGQSSPTACMGVVASIYPNRAEWYGMRIVGARLQHGTATVFMRNSARTSKAWQVSRRMALTCHPCRPGTTLADSANHALE